MAANNSYVRPADFIDPGQPSRCTWHLDTKEQTPHTQRGIAHPQKITPDILQTIGCTPLVRLNNIPTKEGIQCEMFAKCEFMNPGGSVKDRIAYRMIQDAEDKGLLKPGYTIIEPTSGNTGIGLAMACAVKGYKCIIVMPERMSNERVYILHALGAQVVRTPNEAPYDSAEGLHYVAQRLQHETPNSIVLDQFRNAGNPLAHYDGTAAEILWQLDNKVDMVVLCTGTVGTITGIGRKIKEQAPNCRVIGVDPYGSVLARPMEINKTDVLSYEVEGIGYKFPPTVYDGTVIDEWVKVYDLDIFPMSRRLIAEEGLLCGGSSGGAMFAALKCARSLKAGQRCVVILADGVRNYMSRFVSDNWMEARGFKQLDNPHRHWWWDVPISKLKLSSPVATLQSNTTMGQAIEIMQRHGVDQLPMVDQKTGAVLGVVGQETLLNQLVSMNRQLDEPALKAINKRVVRLPESDIVGKLARVLEVDPSVLVVGQNEKILAVVTKADIIAYISNDNSDP
ncbi:cystathionine beta-synthase-like protein isoform X2 [Drosophila albomicans]|nr:cystathionine beta-synthase-like protein isoform X2 [Drosophila albomicans]XP_034114776.2 cystathionine beta-synthase-like protein isoform X2 [Drosophila albomicans]XP_051864103.1 cystathionine beta-synthase-like protein isoform X2 [Drosophila albomicans]